LEMSGWSYFLPRLPWTTTLPISTPQIARITGVSHHAWPNLKVLFFSLCLRGTHYSETYVNFCHRCIVSVFTIA
jgi:hypothetical protein